VTGRIALKLAVFTTVLAIALGAVEAWSRWSTARDPALAERLERFRAYAVSGRHRMYDPHPYTGYQRRRPPGEVTFYGDAIPRERTPGVARVACLGGSTTEGGQGSYPFHLKRLLEERLGRRVEVMNWGVSGWTTAETLVNWVLNAQDYAPDVVVVHHAANDMRARLQPGYRSDYAHYRRPWQDLEFSWLEKLLIEHSDWAAERALARGGASTIGDRVNFPLTDRSRLELEALPPATTAAFRRNVASLCTLAAEGGAGVVLLTMPCAPAAWAELPVHERLNRRTIDEHNRILRELAAEHGARLADSARWVEEHGREAAGWFKDTVHLKPAGNLHKARLVAGEIGGAGWL